MDALSLCVMMSSVDTLTEHQPLWNSIQQLKNLHDVASTGYKSSHLVLTDILTVVQVAVASYSTVLVQE